MDRAREKKAEAASISVSLYKGGSFRAVSEEVLFLCNNKRVDVFTCSSTEHK
jgi:hypothetical protein